MRLLKDDLRELDLFSEASRSELAVIARQLTRLKVKAGRVLVREGGFGNEFMIMVSGMAEVTQNGESIATLGRGDLVGEMAILQPLGSGRRNATVTAITDCEIYAGSAASSAGSWRPPPRWPRRSVRRSPRGLRHRRWSRRPPESLIDGGAPASPS